MFFAFVFIVVYFVFVFLFGTGDWLKGLKYTKHTAPAPTDRFVCLWVDALPISSLGCRDQWLNRDLFLSHSLPYVSKTGSLAEPGTC